MIVGQDQRKRKRRRKKLKQITKKTKKNCGTGNEESILNRFSSFLKVPVIVGHVDYFSFLSNITVTTPTLKIVKCEDRNVDNRSKPQRVSFIFRRYPCSFQRIYSVY